MLQGEGVVTVYIRDTLSQHNITDWNAVEEVAESHCNVCYKRIMWGTTLVLELKQDLVLINRSQELYTNYSIKGYWLPYFASKVVVLQVNHSQNIEASPDPYWLS